MQLENIERDLKRAEQQSQMRKPLHQDIYCQVKYRWVMLAVATTMMILNGLLNNLIIPLQSKLSALYEVQQRIINLPTILSFLVFLLVNVPANYILDKYGIRFGYIVGNSLYLFGIILCCLVNLAFPMLIVGYLFICAGQPFIINIPAKFAACWFLPQNRALATSVLVGANIIGSGIGFAIPTVVVAEDSQGSYAKRQIFSLYLGYAVASIVLLILNFMLVKAHPPTPTSKIINSKDVLSIKETFLHIKRDRNLWKFFISYSLFYGTFLIFGSSSNFLVKPFGLSDVFISLSAVSLILLGAIGAILSSIFIKRTKKYKLLITITTFCSSGALVLLIVFLFIFKSEGLMLICSGLVGFFVVPVVSTSYQIGCQVAFPIGQAQVTGMLNGGAFIWAFIVDAILTAAIGFGTQLKTGIFFLVLLVFLLAGSFLYLKTPIRLKRKQFEQTQSPASSRQNTEQVTPQKQKQIEMTSVKPFQDVGSTIDRNSEQEKYETLNEEQPS